MKSKAFMGALACLLVFAGTAMAQPESASRQLPSAFLPEKSFTFPEVVEGTEVLHEFPILNKGPGPLKILKVQTS